MSGRANSNARVIALGGIITLLSVVSLYLVAILPTNRIFFFWLSTIFLAVMVIEYGIPSAIMTFVSTSILGFILIPNKLVMIPYVAFFGYYAIVKFYIEKINKLIFEWLLKLILFNISTYVIYLITENILFTDINVKLPVLVFIILLQIGFIIYDYFYSIMIQYYKVKIRKLIK